MRICASPTGRMRARTNSKKILKVLYVKCKYTRALTFQNLRLCLAHKAHAVLRNEFDLVNYLNYEVVESQRARALCTC